MKTLIVFNHPHEGSFCNAIMKSVRFGLEISGQPCKIINLDKDRFDPVMKSKDLKSFVQAGRTGEAGLSDIDPLVLKYKKKLEWAEHIVMIFPIWWMSMPAMTKGFVDKVIFPGIAYGMEGGKLKSRLSRLKRVTIISTMNTPADVYRDFFNNSLEGSLIKGTFNQIGIRDVEWISLNKVKQANDEEKRQWLEGIEIRFSASATF